MMGQVRREFIFQKGKRKYLFCGDAEGAVFLYPFVRKVMEEQVPFDILVIDQESDSFLDQWLCQQKMGTFLYVTGTWEVVSRLKKRAADAGFSDYEMEWCVLGPIEKKVICCTCHGVNKADEGLRITCEHCGEILEVSTHFSRRLEAYLGYSSIT